MQRAARERSENCGEINADDCDDDEDNTDKDKRDMRAMKIVQMTINIPESTADCGEAAPA